MVAPGETLAGHSLIERLGQRGAAELWWGRSPEGDQVVVDLMPVRPAAEAATQQLIEARLPVARALSHENVLPLLAGGVDSGHRYWIWPYHEGLFLDRLLESARTTGIWPPPGVSARIARAIAAALDYIHHLDPPLLARELSPACVLLARDGRVLISELGTADSRQSVIETVGRSQGGSAAYLSPELATSGAVGAKSDLFVLGTILWEMLAARPLFQRETDLETLAAVRTAEIPSLPAGCPASLQAIARQLLARAPEARYADARAVMAALDRAMQELPDAGVDAVVDLLEQFSRATGESKKARTFALSEASGGEAAGRSTVESDPPSEVLRAAQDEFFDAVRDGGGLENRRFQILGRLGSGGMGEVYRVHDRELDETVALKIIPKGSSIEMQSIERLRREVRLARRIASDHVCRIYDIVDLGDGSRGLMMELIEGTTLAEMLKTGVEVDYLAFTRWAEQICDGLAAAHGLSIIHRDLKPENVMIRKDGSAVILDFGIARSESPDQSTKLTQAGIIMGTPLYMSPEQLSNRPLDGRSDLYALGLILAELITGAVPRSGANYAEILDARVVKNVPYTLRDHDPNVPEGLASVIESLLRSSANDRPATASRVRDQLRALLGDAEAGESEVVGLQSAPESKREITVPIFLPPPPSRAGWWFAIVLLVMVLGALGFFWRKKHSQAAGPADAGAVEITLPDSGVLEIEPPPPPAPPPPRKSIPDPEPM